jgi:MFS transporter, SP family, galactose:H+ symporter
MQSAKDHFSPYSLYALGIVSLAGLLFGYHTAVISGILDVLTTHFRLTVLQEGLAVSTILLGGLLGSLFAGQLADRFGRKPILLITAFIFCASSLILYYAEAYTLFLMGRLISGVAVGMGSILAPLYLGEVAPPHYRGRFVSLFQLMIGLGILIAYGMNVLLATRHDWHLVFLLSLIPALIQFAGLFFVPETPAWLASHYQKKEAKEAYEELRDDTQWKKSLQQLQHNEESMPPHRFALLQPMYHKVLFIGLILSIFQQITGINTIIYYAPKIFALVAGSEGQELWPTLAIGVINLIATFVALILLDKLGRRLFLLIGSGGMFLCQILLALSFLIKTPLTRDMAVISTLAYGAFFSIGFGPITWVILSEIFPVSIRGKAMGVAIFANWLFNYLISLTFLMFIEKLGSAVTFLLYGAITFLSFIFIYFLIPETKGKSLEQIEAMVIKKKI